MAAMRYHQPAAATKWHSAPSRSETTADRGSFLLRRLWVDVIAAIAQRLLDMLRDSCRSWYLSEG